MFHPLTKCGIWVGLNPTSFCHWCNARGEIGIVIGLSDLKFRHFGFCAHHYEQLARRACGAVQLPTIAGVKLTKHYLDKNREVTRERKAVKRLLKRIGEHPKYAISRS